MLLQYHDYPNDPIALSELFERTFMSPEFTQYAIGSLTDDKHDDSVVLCCAQYLLYRYFPDLNSSFAQSTLDKVALSYTKRHIPIMVTGRFPLLHGTIPNTVLIKGYVGNYFIVNDPRGNANTGYLDRFGENVVYHIDNMYRWVSATGQVTLLRTDPVTRR